MRNNGTTYHFIKHTVMFANTEFAVAELYYNNYTGKIGFNIVKTFDMSIEGSI
jgi:hypothetical protein